jgi:hypothetical protein
MAENFDDEIAREKVDSAAMQLALGSRSEEAREYLKKQSRLVDLQIENLEKQDEYEVSHLRWRRFNDQMRGAMQIMLVAVGALIVVAIAAAVWNASQANGLVVDTFTVPPDFEQHGMGADVIAGDLTDKLAAIRRVGVEHSYSSSNEVTKSSNDDFKVEIPETGVSISEAWRYLRNWLGHERHLSGSLRMTADGKLVLSAAAGDGHTISETGSADDLPKLEQRGAEEIYQTFDPVNYINYLSAQGRHREAYEAAESFAKIAKGRPLADSYGLWSYTTGDVTGDIPLAIRRARIGISIDPRMAVLDMQVIAFDDDIGRAEDELKTARVVLLQRNEDQPPAHQGIGFAEMQIQARSIIALLQGDFSDAEGWYCDPGCLPGVRLSSMAVLAARAHDIDGSRALLSEAFAAGFASGIRAAEARYYMDMEAENWSAALAEAGANHATSLMPKGDLNPRYLSQTAGVAFDPQIAFAQAHLGQFAAAHETIDQTPPDCIPCLVARGQIDALEKKWDTAAFWFARATGLAPSIPFAYTEWGRMLLSQGDTNGAIAKFKIATQKGPRFADPLEMWGEALIRQNRSDLALAEFAQANKYASNWGRLHLKWGEALLWSGNKADAQKQFAIAASLELTPSEKSELSRVTHG